MALSEQWRVQKSTLPAVELANAIRGLQKVIGSVSPETEHISFGGMSFNQRIQEEARRIVIDRDFALKSGEYPIPPEDFDVLVGLAAHEAAHTATVPVDNDVIRGNSAKAITTEEFIQLCEEIYTDNYVRRHFPVHYNYIIMARQAYEIKSDEQNPDGRIDHNNINAVSIAKYIYHRKIDYGSVAPEHLQVHIYLDTINTVLSANDMDTVSRISYYRTQYETIKTMLGTDTVALKQQLTSRQLDDDMPKQLRRRYKNVPTDVDTGTEATPEELVQNLDMQKATDPIHDHKVEESLEEERKSIQANRGKMRDGGATTDEIDQAHPLPNPAIEQLLKDVQESLETEKIDLTGDLILMIDEPENSKIAEALNKHPVTYQRSKNEYLGRSTEQDLLKELDWMKRIKNTVDRQTIRSQAEGTLDKRRLYRHVIDGLTYKKRQVQERQNVELVLLLDSSGSMGTREGVQNPVYKAAHALHTVMPEITVYSYDLGGGSMYSGASELQDAAWDGRMRQISPRGQTPSGEALLGTAYRHPRSLIIHFTDGDSNTGLEPKDAMVIIKDKMPKVQIANIMARPPKAKGSWQYDQLPDNATAEYIENLDEFPDKLKQAIEPWYRSR